MTDALPSPSSTSPGEEDTPRFLIFSLGDELYGCPLTQITEVIKRGAIKAIPYMVSYFKGVINLRGKIVGVIDLAQKLDLGSTTDPKIILVAQTSKGVLGVMVDEVLAVEAIPMEKIETEVAMKLKIAPDCFLGIGRFHDRLINLIRVSEMLAAEEFRLDAVKSA